MSIYLKIYNNLCESRKSNLNLYKPGSGLNRHHIIPSHSGGEDIETNFTYLTKREHKIAHFLLWKINRNVNDLRAMQLIGGNLSVEKRRIIGKWCFENNIGWFARTPEQKTLHGKMSFQLQKIKYEQTGDKNNFYYWSTKEGRQKRSSMGGKIGGKNSFNKKVGIHGLSAEEKHNNSKLGGLASLNQKVGVFSEEGLKRSSDQGKKLKETHSGIFGLSQEDRIKNASHGGIVCSNYIFWCRNFLNKYKTRRFKSREDMLYFCLSNPDYFIDYHYAKLKGKTDDKWESLIKFFTIKERDQFLLENTSYQKCARKKKNSPD